MITYHFNVVWLRSLLYTVIFLGVVVVSSDAQISYYPFELDITDRVGTTDLTNAGGPSLENDIDNCRRILSFEGNGHVNNNAPALGLVDEFTIAFWMNADELLADQKLLGQASILGFDYRGFVIGVQDSLIKAEVFGIEKQGFAGETNYTLSIWDEDSRITSNWTHIGFSLDQTNTLRLYIDGMLKATQQYTGAHTFEWVAPLSTDPLIMGAAPWDTNFFKYQGDLDDVEFYAMALSDTEMMDLSNPKCINYSAIHVNESATGNPSGADWENALSDLQEAIHLSCACPSMPIWVKQGTYKPTMIYNQNSNANLDEKNKTFYIRNAINMYGGFDGTEINLIDRGDATGNNTILDGDLGGLDTAYHVMTIQIDQVVIDGFSFVNGRASNGDVNNGGAILHNSDGAGRSAKGDMQGDKKVGCALELNIVNCIFKNNKAEQGGAFYSNRIPSCRGAEFNNCTFENNEACSGGAVGINDNEFLVFRNSKFDGNSSKHEGGAVYSTGTRNTIEFSDCLINNNQAGSDGGDIYLLGNFGTTQLDLFACNINGNESSGDGGVLYTDASSGGILNVSIRNSLFLNNQSNNGGAINTRSVTNFMGPSGNTRFDLRNNTFKSNTALVNGGAIASNKLLGDIINCLFIENSAVDGGCFHFDAGQGEGISPRILNCTIADNHASGIGASLFAAAAEGFSNPGGSVPDGNTSPKFINSIVWNNTSSDSKEVSIVDLAMPSYDRCIVTNAFNGAGVWDTSLGEELGPNRDDDPLFNTVTNYRLQNLSPAINWGNPTELGHPQIDIDLDNNPRIITPPLVDLGAYENQYDCYANLVFNNSIHNINAAHNTSTSDNMITAYNVIGGSSQVTYLSQTILLDELFEVQMGSVFEADISACSN